MTLSSSVLAVALLVSPSRLPPPPSPPPGVPVAPADTSHARPRAIEISDWYARRLAIHRAASFTVIPLFALQTVAGERLYKHPGNAADWVLPTHRATAAALGAVFAINTVTGLWNLWDSRDVADRRTLRTVHALTMLTADAGFTYAGAVLAKQAINDVNKRSQHRTIALSSMGLSIVGDLMMVLWNR